jgi:hypothetical protein
MKDGAMCAINLTEILYFTALQEITKKACLGIQHIILFQVVTFIVHFKHDPCLLKLHSIAYKYVFLLRMV